LKELLGKQSDFNLAFGLDEKEGLRLKSIRILIQKLMRKLKEDSLLEI